MISAGMRLAETTGLAGLSVNLVVGAAGVAKGSFFYHFGDRTGYLLALHRALHDSLTAQVLLAIAGAEPGAGRLWTSATAYLDAGLRNRGVRALLFEARVLPAIADEARALNEAFAQLCEPDFRAMNRPFPLEAARLWVGLVAEAALIELDGGGAQPALRSALHGYLGQCVPDRA